MQVTIVGVTVPPANGGAKVPDSQAGSGGFDMAMAAVMALLMPNSGEPPPAPKQMAGEPVCSDGIAFPSADLLTQQDMLPEPLLLDASEKAGIPAQANKMANAGFELKQAEQALENSDLRLANLVPDSSNKGLELNKTADESLFAKALGPGGIKDKAETVLAGQNINVNAEGNTAAAAPSGLEYNEERSTPGKTVPVPFTPETNAQAAPAKANMLNETGQNRGTGAEGTEGKGNVVLSGRIETAGAGPAGEAKNESGGFNNSPRDIFQPDPAQINAAGTLSGSAKDLKGVSLPDLKDVVVQEIRHFYNTGKGEPTQIQLKLEPEHLGKLTIKLSYSNGELNAQFYTGSDHVKQILEGSVQQLRESLGRQDLILNQAFVFVGNENSGGTGSQMGFGNRQTEFSPDRYSGRAYPQSKTETDGYNQPDTDSTRVNYLI